MRIIQKVRARTLYHDTKCDFVTIDCKVECLHCPSDDYHCHKCNGHRWLWGSADTPGYGFTPYSLASICL